ncbi:MAG: hypothetical protein HQK51_18180 [Oligoflexia bacterium]|nr:hypothetical protein [Oligoflexia bacterium]
MKKIFKIKISVLFFLTYIILFNSTPSWSATESNPVTSNQTASKEELQKEVSSTTNTTNATKVLLNTKGESKHFPSKKLSSMELFSVTNYTGTCGGSIYINSALREDKIYKLIGLYDIRYIDNALKKLPAWPGKSYRGINFTNENLKKAFLNRKAGDLFIDKAFLSSSKSDKVALSYYGENGIFFEIDGLTGRDLEAAGLGNSNGVEKEILFPRGTKFIIKSINEDIIHLKELE